MRKILIFCFVATLSFCMDIYADFDVVAKDSSDLVFQTSGVVKEIKVDVSNIVKKGDILVVLDDKDESIALDLARNDLEMATLAKSFAKDTLDKFVLVKNEVSKHEFNKIRYEYDGAVLAEKKAKIAIQNLLNQIDKKSLKAPFDGVIISKNTHIGSGVLALNSNVISMISYPDVKIVLKIDEKYMDYVKVGDDFFFKLSGESDERHAKISLIYPTIDAKSKKFIAEAYYKDIKVGRYGEGYIKAKR